MPQIHPLAVVENGATLAESVVVGPFAYVGPKVTLGQGCIVHHHASIDGHTTAGDGNEFFPNSVIGGPPQDLKYRGGDCQVIIGHRNKFREASTVNVGTEDGGYYTRIGDDNLFMVGVHIAHDCLIGSHCIFANNVLLAGHVAVEDWVVLAGAACSHHFVTFGQHAFVGGLSAVTHDVPPFMIAHGQPAGVRGVNVNGLKRRGFTEEQLDSLKTAYRLLFRDNSPMGPQFAELERLYPKSGEIALLLESLRKSTAGRFGRFRESLRQEAPDNQEDPGTVSGN